MSGDIIWRSAIPRDRAALMNFTCTERGRKNPLQGWRTDHPRPWELRVQSGIRDLRPPYRSPKFLLVGFEPRGIAAAAYYEELDGPGFVNINLVAVAERYRHTPERAVSKQLAEELEAALFDRVQEVPDLDRVVVTSVVHPENKASRRFCEEAGLEEDGALDDGHLVYRIEHVLLFD